MPITEMILHEKGGQDRKMHFNFINRGYREWLLIIPGWGFISNIFSRLDLAFNYILPAAPVISDITRYMPAIIRVSGTKKIHVLGWSLGATAAAIIIRERNDMIKTASLISVMQCFSASDAKKVYDDIRHDRQKALEKFHRLCFTGQKKDYIWFTETLQQETIRQWDRHSLESGLQFLVKHKFDSSILRQENISCFHGSRDIIAPLDRSPCRHFKRLYIIKGAGHLPFLTELFHSLHDTMPKKTDS